MVALVDPERWVVLFSTLRRDDGKPTCLHRERLPPYDDLDILVERHHQIHQAFDGKPACSDEARETLGCVTPSSVPARVTRHVSDLPVPWTSSRVLGWTSVAHAASASSSTAP